MPDPEESLSEQLLNLKKKTSWSWEAMCREFHRVMQEEGPSNTTLFRYASKKVKRHNPLVERYVQEAIHKIEIELVQKELTESEGQRKRAVDDLHETEARFRKLVENAQDVIFRVVPGRGFEYISPAVANMVGYTPEEYYADPDLAVKVIHPDDRSKVHPHFRGEGSNRPVILRGIHKGGGLVWMEHTLVSIFDDAGNVVAVEGIARDVTERKRGEEATLYLAAIVESSEDAIVGTAPDGTIMSWNPAAEKLSGYTAEEAIGQRISLIHPQEDPQRFDRIHEKLSKGERVDNPDSVMVSKSGERINVSVKSSAIKDSQGRIIGASGIIRDIRERKLGSDG